MNAPTVKHDLKQPRKLKMKTDEKKHQHKLESGVLGGSDTVFYLTVLLVCQRYLNVYFVLNHIACN